MSQEALERAISILGGPKAAADRMAISLSTISKWRERGASRLGARRLAALTHVPLGDLYQSPVRPDAASDAGDALRLGRLSLGLSLAQLGEMIGVSAQFLHKVESGGKALPESRKARLPLEIRWAVDDAAANIDRLRAGNLESIDATRTEKAD